MAASPIYRFGRFEIDTRTHRVLADGDPLPLSDRYVSVLLRLAATPGTAVSKDDLIRAAWGDVAVTDNSLEQAISVLRRTLGRDAGGRPLLETVPRRGYRLAADVTRSFAPASEASVDSLLEPHRAWIDGRAALESLSVDRITHARTVFEHVVSAMPDHAPAHVGLANACVLQFEMTRADEAPDLDALRHAAEHARLACRIDSAYGEAWATLGFVLERTGPQSDALAAARRAIALEPDNWRHHLRLASMAWGEERLRAARQTLGLFPGCALARWLAATVLVARHTLASAARELETGIEDGRAQPAEPRFGAVGLHWLSGLIHLAAGDAARADEAFARELEGGASGHLYARECAANTWYAVGASHLRRGRHDAAADSFTQALTCVANHAMARVGLALATGADTAAPIARGDTSAATRLFEAALCEAIALVHRGEQVAAARRLEAALMSAPAGNAGWLVPVEPLLYTAAAPDVWAPVLALVRARAA